MPSKGGEMREQDQSLMKQQWRMNLPSQSWYVVSKPVGPFDSGLIPSQHQVGREESAHIGTPQPLDCQNVEVVGDLCNKDKEEGNYEYSWHRSRG